jgi:hypothetical protein
LNSETDIANSALFLLGQSRVSTIDESSKNASLCKAAYEYCRDEVLRMTPWSCARKRESLVALSTAPVFAFAYAYQLPSDFVRLIVADTEEAPFEIVGKTIETDNKAVDIKYVRRITVVGEMDSLLASAIAARLAQEICLSITGNQELRSQVTSVFVERLNEARFVNGTENDRESLDPEGFVRGRYTGPSLGTKAVT